MILEISADTKNRIEKRMMRYQILLEKMKKKGEKRK